GRVWPFRQAVYMYLLEINGADPDVRRSYPDEQGPWKVGTAVMTMMKLSISYGQHWKGLAIWTGRVYVFARN
ncbi:hypothetical protein PJP10_31390, partial [Mycobacterium kansasii]